MKKRLIKLIFCVFILMIFLCLPLSAQKETAEKGLEGFKDFIKQEMEKWEVPGCAIAIVKDGKVIFAEGFGYRDVKNKLAVTPETLFAIGSCSKAFTATAMGILVDEGKLNWDSPAREYLPTFKMYDLFATERMTPRDLVCHRSGLPRHDDLWYNSPFSRKEIFDRIQYLEPSKDFRSYWQYQNIMFMTAGYMVGHIANTTWEKFVQERIFNPLGMDGSNFSVEDSKKAPDFALPYTLKEEKIEEIPFRNIDNIGPAGSINSSVTDMAKWILLNLNKGKWGDKQIITEATMSQIHGPQMAMPGSIEYDEMLYNIYAMGWVITPYRGHLLLHHGGGIDGFISWVSFMPRDNMGLVVLTNSDSSPLTQIIGFTAYDRLLGLKQVDWSKRFKEERDKAKEAEEKAKKEKEADRKTDTKPSHPLKDYAGDYENAGYGIISIKLEDDKLAGTYNAMTFPLKHYHYDIFEIEEGEPATAMIKGLKVSFVTNKKGDIDQLSVPFQPDVKDIIFTRAAAQEMKEKSFLEQFVGEYALADTAFAISLKGDDTLILTIAGQPEYELVPYKGTEFNLKNLSGFSIKFNMNESGAVTEAILTQPNGVFTAKKK
jgi:CubicO group peptidase (beta-lactamase class C family)